MGNGNGMGQFLRALGYAKSVTLSSYAAFSHAKTRRKTKSRDDHGSSLREAEKREAKRGS
jgi:hypothetical protein